MSAKNCYGLSSYEYARIYDAWKHMISRCCDESNKSYIDYGGRGISVCNAWLNSFHAFVEWALQNGWERGLTLDRINVNGNYSPNNCRWASRKQQNRNTRKNIWISIDGEEKCLSEWCEIFNFPYGIARVRYAKSGLNDPNELFYRGDIRELRPKIVQISLYGDVIAEYSRIKDAEAKSGISRRAIQNALSGRCKTSGGYLWKYKNMEVHT